MDLSTMIENAVISIESIKEYYFSQIDVIKDNIEKESEKYCLGFVIDNYINAMMKVHLNYIDKVPEELNMIGPTLLEDLEFNITEDIISCKYKIKDKEKYTRLGFELNAQKASKEYHKLQERLVWFGNSTLIMLIIKFEEAIANFFNYLIINYPNAYLSKKTLTYSEILEINIEDFKSALAKKEVEELMRQNISDWYIMFKQKHNIETLSFTNYYNEFLELYYRRNIIVHNNGIVNKNYIQGVDEKFRNGIILNQLINADKDYLKRAFDITYIMIYGTFFQAIKLCESKIEIYDLFFDLGFTHMMNKEWEVSKYIFKNLEKAKDINESDKMMSQINFWISEKNGGDFDKIRVEIENCDLSAKETKFKLAKLILLDNFKKAVVLLEKTFPNEISSNALETWPLFIQFRESIEYIEFKNEHFEDFELYEYTQDITNKNDFNNLKDEITQSNNSNSISECVAATIEKQEPIEPEKINA